MSTVQSGLKSTAITIIVLVLVIILGGYFGVWPLWNKFAQTQDQISSARMENSQLQTSAAEADSFLAQYQKHEEVAATIGQALPAQTWDPAGFVSTLGQLASSSGVLLSNFQISSVEDAAAPSSPTYTIKAQTIDVTATGTYPAFKNFILLVEQQLRVIDINHITLKQEEDSQLGYQINLTTYYQQ